LLKCQIKFDCIRAYYGGICDSISTVTCVSSSGSVGFFVAHRKIPISILYGNFFLSQGICKIPRKSNSFLSISSEATRTTSNPHHQNTTPKTEISFISSIHLSNCMYLICRVNELSASTHLTKPTSIHFIHPFSEPGKIIRPFHETRTRTPTPSSIIRMQTFRVSTPSRHPFMLARSLARPQNSVVKI
jgi:hypothetical protein